MAQSGLRRHDLTLRPHSTWDDRPPVPERFIPVDRRVTAYYQTQRPPNGGSSPQLWGAGLVER